MDKELEEKSEKVIKILEDNDIKFESYEHEPIFSYEVAEIVSKKLGFTGTESKSLFLKGKSGKYYVYFTIQGEKVDFKNVKNLVGEKISICSSEEMTEVIGCYPGCVSPFGHSEDITLIIDLKVFEQEKIIFSPGVPNKTVIVYSKDLKNILDKVECEKFFMEEECQ